ncbi:MAG: hypothetical protein RL091_405, partial [Verrucomicrobiota bacterium]
MRLIAPIEDYATKRHTPALRATPLDPEQCRWQSATVGEVIVVDMKKTQ